MYQACTKREKILLVFRMQKSVEINACCGSICNDQKALFSPQRKVHEDRDSEGIQHKKAGCIDEREGEHRWAEFAVVVLEEPEIKVAIECSHGDNAYHGIHGK
jgi:hypothetical protein